MALEKSFKNKMVDGITNDEVFQKAKGETLLLRVFKIDATHGQGI